MINGTIKTQRTYVVNLLVTQTDLNIDDNPMNASTATSHATITVCGCKDTKKGRKRKGKACFSFHFRVKVTSVTWGTGRIGKNVMR